MSESHSIGPQSPPPLIPREVLFGNPERASPALSPDGKHLAYLAPDENDVMQVWLRTPEGEADRRLTADKKRGIRMFFWTFTPDCLIYMQDSDGDENWHLYAVNISSGTVRDLTPFQGVRAELTAMDADTPGEILVQMNLRDPKTFDVHRVDLRTGAVEEAAENPGNVIVWQADSRLRVLAATGTTEDGGFDLMLRPSPEEEWKVFRHLGPDDEGFTIGFSGDARTLYVLSSHDADATRLLAVDTETLTEAVIAADDEYDVQSVLRHPKTKLVQAVALYKERLHWEVLDEDLTEDFQAIGKIRRGDFRIDRSDLTDRFWIVAYSTDDGPTYYYLYDRTKREAELLWSNQPRLEDAPLARMEPISFLARDGLTIHGYLTMPIGVEQRDLPAVLLVHGGPWWRDTWGYDSMVQWLANRGYAVLQVNFRGSNGYGKGFLNAGNREWAGKMHDDLIDGVEWLKQRGIADGERIAIMGGSYGGYATLVGLTFTPEVFACGVDLVGPSSLTTLIRSIPPYWAPLLKLFNHRLGDVESEREFLDSRSPLSFVDRICRPLLIGQGANDPRVKQAESDQIVEAMRKANLPVEYIVYGDEGHGFARPENRMHFYARAERFLATYLSGRSEPIGEIAGHSGEDG